MSARNHEFTFYGCGSHYVGVRAYTASCGWTDYSYGYFSVSCSGGWSAVTVSPNPTTDFVDISVERPETERTSTIVEYAVTLFGENGELAGGGITTGGKLRLDVSNLPEGKYYLHVPYGEGIVQRHIIVSH